MYPEVTEVPLMTPLGYEVWKKRWNKEAKSRKVISDAFETYKEMYGEDSPAWEILPIQPTIQPRA
jgi:hypothetical protein